MSDPVKPATPPPSGLNRRDFLSASAVAGAGLAMTAPSLMADTDNDGDLRVAIVGLGAQGKVQRNALMKIDGVKIVAVCDIWDYNRRYTTKYLSKFKIDVNDYANIDEMLEKETDLDAVFIATPDFMHAPHTIKCLEAGKHVYCEKMMSNSIEAAADMVRAARRTKKLCQIGHQRRSNPRYLHVKNKLIGEAKLFGGLTHANAQWNRGKSEPLGWPKKYTMDADALKKYGYGSMEEFRNWRWYKKYGGGPISDLGAHQIDILNWFFGGPPKSVMASGGIDFYPDYEHLDNIMSIYEYDTPRGIARGFYQVLTTSSSLGFLERFMGLEGTLAISENPKWNDCFREPSAPDWAPHLESGLLGSTAPEETEGEEEVVDSRESAALESYPIPVDLGGKLIHQPHVENFLDAIRNGTPLNCPAEVGYQTCVTVLKINEAVAQGKRVDFKPEEFIVS